jgi:hypothetical protein
MLYEPRGFISPQGDARNYGGGFIENLIVKCLYAKLGLGNHPIIGSFMSIFLRPTEKSASEGV